jgi:hypothetical protein
MELAVEIGSGVMTYITSFIKTGLCIQKLIEGIHTDSMEISYAYVYFFTIRNAA